ncbi:hypothetical protein EYF80_026390 [Liparis tanakae]|uniref:Uncharacterized protein n=1 Tax=Liparis tanakae TaxID=230148 RepID=A0A4Z2HBY0_9TELE|nr:hypothetical protein EYF80_026390 [Liparis tanakae]
MAIELSSYASFCGVPRRLWWMIDATLVVVDRMTTDFHYAVKCLNYKTDLSRKLSVAMVAKWRIPSSQYDLAFHRLGRKENAAGAVRAWVLAPVQLGSDLGLFVI